MTTTERGGRPAPSPAERAAEARDTVIVGVLLLGAAAAVGVATTELGRAREEEAARLAAPEAAAPGAAAAGAAAAGPGAVPAAGVVAAPRPRRVVVVRSSRAS